MYPELEASALRWAEVTCSSRRSIMQSRGAVKWHARDPIFSTVAKLVEALGRSIPEGSQNAEHKKEALRLGRELLRGTKYEGE